MTKAASILLALCAAAALASRTSGAAAAAAAFVVPPPQTSARRRAPPPLGSAPAAASADAAEAEAAERAPVESGDNGISEGRRELPTPEESARQLTEYMAKAHEEKIRAVADAEAKLKDRIKELEARVAELTEELESKSPTDGGVPGEGGESYLLPATNRALAESVLRYREFLSDYLIKSQLQKAEAVAAAEAKLREAYEEKIAELRSSAGAAGEKSSD